MATRAEWLKEYYGMENGTQAMSYLCQTEPSLPLEQLVKMPIPYESANHPPLPSVDEINRAGGYERVCTIGECVIKRNTSNMLFQVSAATFNCVFSSARPHKGRSRIPVDDGSLLLIFPLLFNPLYLTYV